MAATNWPQADNKQYIGHLDRIYVSMTEYYERHYYVDHYLLHAGFVANAINRQAVNLAMEQFPGRAPIMRTAMDAFLNRKFGR